MIALLTITASNVSSESAVTALTSPATSMRVYLTSESFSVMMTFRMSSRSLSGS